MKTPPHTTNRYNHSIEWQEKPIDDRNANYISLFAVREILKIDKNLTDLLARAVTVLDDEAFMWVNAHSMDRPYADG